MSDRDAGRGASEPLLPGERVRLVRGVSGVPSGEEGVVIGFFRREVETVVVRFAGAGGVVEMRPEELVRIDP